mgnify:CR=1 FL=1
MGSGGRSGRLRIDHRNLEPGIPVIKLDHNINDLPFADKAAEILLEIFGRTFPVCGELQ